VLAEERFLEHEASPLAEKSYLTGQTIGAYKLISRVGQGGMGNVWLAERVDGRFERQVAVKFLHFALTSPGAAERFKREGKILGQLAHPHIAELIDAGVTPKGEPCLVLEYVDGTHIDEYCDQHKLAVDARIKLFLDVLGAVAHAHANLIVHRDIKPSNVLVRRDGQVKLLDFGIAKLLAEEGDAASATQLTLEGGAALTPQFAAPEQLTAGVITTATDVYSLGVLLYILLAGQHPVGPGPRSPAELVRAITDIEPPRASSAFAAVDAKATAENRATTPDKLRRQLRGDLDTVMAKALKKNQAERYTSVTTLTDDLRRFLSHQPVSARPDTPAYRAAKFVRRNGTAVALSAVALLAIIAGLTGTLMQARAARQQRDSALRERDRASRITGFMTNMFKVSDPAEARGNTITVREVLDKASSEIGTGLAKDAETQADMMNVMGDVYDDLGLYPRAESLYRRAFEIRSGIVGPNHPDILESKRLLGWVLEEEGHYAEAEKLQRETLEGERRVLGPERRETLASMNDLAADLFKQGRYAEAEKLYREAFDTARRVLGPENRQTLAHMNNLAGDIHQQGRYAEAEKLQRTALDTERRVLGSDNPVTLDTMDNLALTLRQEERYAEAEKLQREAFDTTLRVLGPEHPQTLHAKGTLALILKREGHYAEAEKLFRQELDVERRVLGPDHSQTAETVYNLGCMAALKGNRDEALSLVREAVDHGLIPPYDDQLIEQDTDLNLLHGDPRFGALLAHAKKRAASQKSN